MILVILAQYAPGIPKGECCSNFGTKKTSRFWDVWQLSNGLAPPRDLLLVDSECKQVSSSRLLETGTYIHAHYHNKT